MIAHSMRCAQRTLKIMLGTAILWSSALLSGCGGHEPAEEQDADCTSTPVLSVQRGDHQTERPGTHLGPLVVRLRCTRMEGMGSSYVNIDIINAEVKWRVVAGNGALGAASSTTNVDGFASMEFTLGPDLGNASIEASHVIGSGSSRGQTLTAYFTVTAALPSACQTRGGVDHGPMVRLDVDTTWGVSGSPHHAGAVVLGPGVRLTVEPGTVVCVQLISSPGDGAVIAEGTAAAPILFSVDDPATEAWGGLVASSLKHVTVENANGVAFAPGVTPVIEDSTFWRRAPVDPLLCAQINLFTPAGTGRMLRSTVDGHGGTTCAAVHAAAALGATLEVEARITRSVSDGMLMGGSGTVSAFNCWIHTSGRHGVYVFAPGQPQANPTAVSINDCNMGPNAGNAIFSEAGISVNATGNWWGDPSGPLNGIGGGLQGLIDAGAWLTAPVVLNY